MPDGSLVIEGDALRESEVKWSFIDWVNALTNAKQQKAASFISSALDVDLATATQLIDFSAEAASRVDKITRDMAPETCSALRSANSEQSFVAALESLDLRWDNRRAEVLGDFDSSFAGDAAAKIRTFFETKIRPGQKQIKTDLHKVLADPEMRKTVRSRACAPFGK
jgi:predicted lipoprotein